MSASLPSVEKIAEIVNERGMSGAAERLGISPASVCRILKRNGYKIQRVYVLTPEAKSIMSQQKQAVA